MRRTADRFQKRPPQAAYYVGPACKLTNAPSRLPNILLEMALWPRLPRAWRNKQAWCAATRLGVS